MVVDHVKGEPINRLTVDFLFSRFRGILKDSLLEIFMERYYACK